MMREAFRSLRKDPARSFFYWLTFVVTAMFMFTFFNISMGDTLQVTFIDSRADVATNLTIIVIILASIDIFFANDFFVKSKAKTLGVQLICGASYFQLVQFLLSQTFLLLVTAIPVGILISIVLIPLLNLVLSLILASSMQIQILPAAALATALVLLYVIFWTTILNLAYAYRNTAKNLMIDNGTGVDMRGTFNFSFSFSPAVRGIFALVLFLAPFAGFYVDKETIFLMALISLVGLLMCISSMLVPTLDRLIREKNIDQPLKVASLGFLRDDFRRLKKNILLLIISAIVLLSMMMSTDHPMEIMLVLVSFVVMNILQLMSIMFTLFTIITGRVRNFRILRFLGFLDEDVDRAINHEILLLYGGIALIGMLYLGNTSASLIINGEQVAGLIPILVTGYMVPLLVTGVVSLIYYRIYIKKHR